MEEINPINKVSIKLFKKYNKVIQEAKDTLPDDSALRMHLMGIHAISNPDMPVDKMARWLGFIQGVLYSHNLLDILKERNETRDLYHMAYQELDIDLPEPIDVIKTQTTTKI